MKIPTKEALEAAKSALPERPAAREARLYREQTKALARVHLIDDLGGVISHMRELDGFSAAPLVPLTHYEVLLYGVKPLEAGAPMSLARIARGGIFEFSEDDNTVRTTVPTGHYDELLEICKDKRWSCKLLQGGISL